MTKNRKGYIKTSFTLDAKKYQEFKNLCKINHSDASKEIRKFIDEYIERHKTNMKLKDSIL
jgi:hypothetical protein